MAGSSLKPHSTSSDWPRELAERAVKQKCESRGGDAPFGWSADAHEVYVFGKLVLQTENKKRADKCHAELIAKAEAVIREAIDKTLQHVEQISKHGWMDSLHFDYHLGEDVQDLTISQTAESCKEAHRCIDTDGYCTAKEVLVLDAATIRSLKQSNSG